MERDERLLMKDIVDEVEDGKKRKRIVEADEKEKRRILQDLEVR